ncbi:MAG TPA: alpha/beta hydrolase [Draconibacterium sp.]|nr:alpha/beta hydrolase [Draconibacterium sp.]
MKTILKRFLKDFLIILVLFILVMLTPRTIGLLFPEKAPIAYHFELLDYLAIGVGLEKLVNTEPEIPANIEEFKNIEYKNVNGKSLQIDLYKPKNLTEPAPLLVFVHGGGWKGGKRSDYLVYLVDFAEKGYVTATVSYRLKNDSIYPACVQDVSDAMHFLFSNAAKYGYDPDRVAMIGGSAGGHLVLMTTYDFKEPTIPLDSVYLANRPHKIKAVVDIYGPVDMTTPYAQTQGLVTGFIGHSYSEKPELYWEASPAKYLRNDLPPTLIFQGTSDNLLPQSQSDTLKARLDRLGVPNEYYRLPLWPHAMDVALRPNIYMQKKMDAFFKKYLW